MGETQTQLLRLNGFTRTSRHQMIPLVRDAILKTGGDILDAYFFSNISLCVNFELSAQRIEHLQTALADINLQLSIESLEALATFGTPAKREKSETYIPGTLQITFIHNEPDLRIEVPPIPG
ncbi:MAG TPA: hypothetical protein VF658_08085 [Pyrinomonadaceae bacterium]